MKIGACIMVRNMAPFIGACVQSLSWVDAIYVYDDGSTDGSSDVARQVATVPLVVEYSDSDKPAFFRGQLEVRNHILTKAFALLGCDLLFSVDADELLAASLRHVVEANWQSRYYDRIALSMWHLFDCQRYLHFWETTVGNTWMIDPHVRGVTKGLVYKPLFLDGKDPIIHANQHTLVLHGPYHFHLKYFHLSPYPNYALPFLPERITEDTAKLFLRTLPFALPVDITQALSTVDWTTVLHQETPYYQAYQTERVNLCNPAEALRHPGDQIGGRPVFIPDEC